MQTARYLVVIGAKFATCVQSRQNQLNTRLVKFGMNIGWHTAPIILDRQRTIGMQRHYDVFGVSCQCLINGVVDDLLRQVIWACGISVHTRATTDRV